MSLHKLTAGDGYTYLTRQVAASDATERGTSSLGEYYTEKGESPGRWMGAGLVGLASETLGSESAVVKDSAVAEAQMLALFGEGRHPNATVIEKRQIAAGATPTDALAATKLGKKFLVFEESPEFQKQLAQRFTAHNSARGERSDAPIPDEVRAGIRTTLGRELFAQAYGREPADERELSGFIARAGRQATTAVAGYDLTFSPVKSVSALWAVAPREMSEEIAAAHEAAVADTVGWLETHAAYTRVGTHGVRQVETTGLIGAAFTHRDSRAGDPDLHTHVAISNKVQTRAADGEQKWLALDGRVLHKAAVAASERYNTRLEAHLIDRLGVSFAERAGTGPVKRAVREVVGVDGDLMQVWSSRRAAIEVRRGELSAQFRADHGRAPSPVEALGLAQQATLETRDAKHEPRSLGEQRQAWRGQAHTVLGGETGLSAMIHQAVPALKPQPRTVADAQWVEVTAAQVLTTVSGRRATWQEDHIRAEAERSARTAGVPLAHLDAAVDAVVTVALHPGHSIRLSAVDEELLPPLEADEATGAELTVPAAVRRSDGDSVYTVARTQLFTCEAVLDAEVRLLGAAGRTGGRVATGTAVDMALLESVANGRELNPGQAHLVRELATSGARLQVALAPAGTGKTTAMSVLARAWAEDGGHVVGVAPTANAAAVLGTELGVATDTVDKLVHTLAEQADPANADRAVRVPQWVADIGPDTLVLVDEAAMVGTPNLDALVTYVTDRGGSVRLVGDDQQLAAVAAGGVVRDIAETAGAVTLTHVVRFDDPAEGAASLAIRDGDVAGVGFYLDHHRVKVGDPATVVDQAYTAWQSDTAAGKDSVLLAPTRELVAELNTRARADRIAANGGEAGREVVLGDGSAASAGDVITTRRNDRRLVITTNDWVRNGDRWTVQDVTPTGAIRARHHSTGRTITLPASYVAEYVDLGYARTIHAAQGLTAGTAHTVLTGRETRQQLYVALTRGRASNHLYAQTATDGDPHAVLTPDAVHPSTAAEFLDRVLAQDGAQHSASTTHREATAPETVLTHAAGAYEDALGVAAISLTDPAVLTAIDTAANTAHPGLTDEAAYPTLRAHLALLALSGRDPVDAVQQAAASRELRTAHDVAAVLDWRLDMTGKHSAGLGPLPWLPAVPAVLATHPQWGRYLGARARLVADTAADVRGQAAVFTPTTAPRWARPLVGEDPELVSRLAVWRAATGVDPADRRPTGPDANAVAVRRYQQRLDRAVADVLGHPNAATARWAPLVSTHHRHIAEDPYWPVLADRLSAAHRAGLPVDALVTAAATSRPLPDELPAAALWWRLSGQLSPAALDAAGETGMNLRPDWAPQLGAVLGDRLATRVMADPAWPALVAAVDAATHHGWTPTEVLGAAHDLLTAAHDSTEGGAALAAGEVATALVWRVDALTRTERTPGADVPLPPEPDADETWDQVVEFEDRPADADAVLHQHPDLTSGVDDTTLAADPARADPDAATALGVDSTEDAAYLAAVLADEPATADDELVLTDEVIGEEWATAADWDGALLTELPYTDLPPEERVQRTAADLDTARTELRQAMRAVFDGTAEHQQAAAPMITALRQRADDLRPFAAEDSYAHQAWIEAAHSVEDTESDVTGLRRELATAREAGDTATVAQLQPVVGTAELVLENGRANSEQLHAAYDSAHRALLDAAGPAGIITPTDVEFARLAAMELDTTALTHRRDQVRALEGALLRAENHAAHQHALTHTGATTTVRDTTSSEGTQVLQAPTATGVQEQRGVQARLTAHTTTQDVRPGQRSNSAELVHRVQLTQPDRAQPVQAAQPQDTAADPEASRTLGWRRGLGPRPEDPAQARQWAFTTSMVDTYRSDYHITSTDPSALLGAPPPPGSEQALAYHAVNREWKATTMTNAQDTPEADSDVQRRLADLDHRLSELTQHRDADTDLEDEVDEQDYEQDYQEEEGAVVQDGITDEHGFGYGTGYTDRHRGDGQGAHMGY